MNHHEIEPTTALDSMAEQASKEGMRLESGGRTLIASGLVVIGVSAATACQSADDDDANPGAGTGGAAAGSSSDAGHSGSDTTSGGTMASGGAAHAGGATGDGGIANEGGVTSDAGAAATGGSGGAADSEHGSRCPFANPGTSGNAGDLWFDAAEPCDAVGKALFLFGDRLYWQYEREGKSFIARGSKHGGTAEIVVESAEPIGLFDARGVVAYQAGEQLFVLPPSSSDWLELEAAPRCLALTSTAAYVYCRTVDQSILRWPANGGEPTLFASELGGGVALLANPLEDILLFFVEGSGLLTLALRPVPPPASPPTIWDRPPPYAPRSSHTFRMLPGNAELYFMEPSDSGGTRIVSKKNGIQADGLDNAFDFAPLVGVGVAIATDLGDGSARLTLPPTVPMTLDYTSRDGIAGMASEPRHLYWLDKKGRVYHGVPIEPDYGHDDDFTSSLDERLLADLSPQEAQRLCDELIDYTDPPSHEALSRAACVDAQQASESSVAACEARAEECLETTEWSFDTFSRDVCLKDITEPGPCPMTVAHYSACIVVQAGGQANYVRTATCEATVGGGEVVRSESSRPRACYALAGICSS